MKKNHAIGGSLLTSVALAVIWLSLAAVGDRAVVAAAPSVSARPFDCACMACVEGNDASFNGLLGSCDGVADYTGTWYDDMDGGSQEITEGVACDPGSTSTCQNGGGSPAEWACSSVAQNPSLPDGPTYDEEATEDSCEGNVAWQTFAEEDFGPYPLPSDDDNNNYDSCNSGSCYISYDLEEVGTGDIYSDEPAVCYEEDCSDVATPPLTWIGSVLLYLPFY